MERYYGGTNAGYWAELISEVSQTATAPKSGTYCMTFNPYVTGDPHALVGRSGDTLGNTTSYAINSYTNRYWYFRWYQKWESGATYGGLMKTIYINYSSSNGAGVLVLEKGDNGRSWHTIAAQGDDYDDIERDYWTSTVNVDDGQWHLMEVYVDWGTTGGGNGKFWIKIDGYKDKELTNLTWASTIPSAKVTWLMWPGNESTASGSQNLWYDDLEIYTLTNEADIPPEGEDGPAPPTLSGVSATGVDF